MYIVNAAENFPPSPHGAAYVCDSIQISACVVTVEKPLVSTACSSNAPIKMIKITLCTTLAFTEVSQKQNRFKTRT